ncbi:MAG: serine/threonine-protein kinase [Planctomycetota bacterium]
MTDIPSDIPPTPDPAGSGGEPAPKKSSSERRLLDAVFGQADARPSAFAAEDLPPADSFPGYEILREIHRGGQGVVYLAIQKATKRRVAVKVLHEGPFAGSSGKSRFDREVQVLGQLNHPNIVRIHDSGTTTTGSLFYVMDYISGRSLDAFISGKSLTGKSGSRSGKPNQRSTADTIAAGAGPDGDWSVNDVLAMFLKICEGVNAAHLKGVIHRDLKPANIRVDQAGDPVVVDFGLAKVAVPGLTDESARMMTATGQFIGSLPWASPEQAEGSPDAIDVRTDVYSLGVILYQLLTGGKFPYQVVGNMRDVLDNILRAEPARPSTVRRQVNDEVETIVLKCLAKDKSRRYQSAGELARDIEHYLKGEPIEAKRDSAWYVITKTLSRHRVTAGVVLAFAALISASAITLSILYSQERSARAEADTQTGIAKSALAGQAEQAARAKANFNAGRVLAKAFMFDFNTRIRSLRGSTGAREDLVRKALEYLDTLKFEVGDDPELLRELADAYDQVGIIEGGLYMPRTGTTDSAEGHFKKAADIRQAMLARLPKDARSHSDIAKSLQREGWILERHERYKEAQDCYERAQAAVRSALTMVNQDSPEASKYRLDLAELLTSTADSIVRQAEKASDKAQVDELVAQAQTRYAGALDTYWQPRLNANPGDAEARQRIGVLAAKHAVIMISRGRAANDLAESILKSSGKVELPPAARALLLEAMKRFDEAIPEVKGALDKLDDSARNNPASAIAERDVFFACNNLGIAISGKADSLKMLDERAGMRTLDATLAQAAGGSDTRAIEKSLREEAQVIYDRALAITARLADNDAKNIDAQREWAVALNKVGNERRWLARLANDPKVAANLLDSAIRAYTKSRDLRASLLKTDRMQRHTRDLGLAEFKLGQGYAALARAATDPAAKAAAIALAQTSAQAAQKLFASLVSDSVMAQDAPEMLQTAELLADLKAL